MQVYIIKDGVTVATITGAVKIQVVNDGISCGINEGNDDNDGDRHIDLMLTEEGIITDLVESAEVAGTSSQTWEELCDELEGEQRE